MHPTLHRQLISIVAQASATHPYFWTNIRTTGLEFKDALGWLIDDAVVFVKSLSSPNEYFGKSKNMCTRPFVSTFHHC
jgi:hypothetical protein